MSKLLVVLLFLVVIEDMPILASTPQERSRRDQINCTVVGRLQTDGDLNFRAGSLLCEQDKITILNGGFVKLFCYSQGRTVVLFGGTVSNSCPKRRPITICKNQSNQRKLCPKPKGGIANSNSPAIIVPYGSSILQSRPDIAWHPVQGATSYIVRLSGEGVEWKVNTNQTKISYPKEENGLQFGSAYELTVIAKNEHENLTSTKILNRLTKEEVESLENEINSYKTILNLPADQLALDLSEVFISKNLFTEAVEILEMRAKQASQDSTVYRQLGDLYSLIGDTDLAEKNYKIANTLSEDSLTAQKNKFLNKKTNSIVQQVKSDQLVNQKYPLKTTVGHNR